MSPEPKKNNDTPKVFYLSTSTLASASANSVHVMKMCQAFAKIGWDVTLHGIKGTGQENAKVHAWYGTQPCFQIKRWTGKESQIVNAIRTIREKISFLRVGFIPDLLYGYFCIGAHIKRDVPDLVFARHIYWLAGSRLTKTPFIIESHHPPCGYLDRKIQGSLFSKPNFRGLVVISDALRDIYLRDYPKLSQIIVAHDAANDPGIWHGVQRNKSQPHAIRIGYVGHLYNGRGRGLIKKLAQRLPHITFDIVGGTPADLEVFKRFDLTKNIVLHGFQPHSELDKFYKAFDVVIAPYQKKVAVDGNKGDTSGFMSPLKIFEYMSWGLPMIVSDLPALREILSEKSAVLVKTDDLDAWSEAIADLARDDAKRRHLGTEARRQFLAHHTWDIRAKTIELNLCENQL